MAGMEPRVPRIAISLCGEGRGHATRVSALIGRLEDRHEILVWASADALEFLRCRFGDRSDRVRIQEAPGLVFEYTAGRLDLTKSIAAGIDFSARRLGPLVDRMLADLETFGADLVIVDMEPALPRAAARLGLPVVSVDHQHFLLAYDLDVLPTSLRWMARLMSYAVLMHVPSAEDTVVSAFFRPPLRHGWEHVRQVGPLLRPEVTRVRASDAGFLLSYLRRNTPFSAIEALADCGLPVRIFGLGERKSVGGASFHGIDQNRFVADLAACTALVSAAGNQLIGEALHLGKPLLVMPERGHAEQLMNSHFLRSMGCGDFCSPDEVTSDRIRDFLDSLAGRRNALAAVAGRLDGTDEVVEIIERRLAASRASPPAVSRSLRSGTPAGESPAGCHGTPELGG